MQQKIKQHWHGELFEGSEGCHDAHPLAHQKSDRSEARIVAEAGDAGQIDGRSAHV